MKSAAGLGQALLLIAVCFVPAAPATAAEPDREQPASIEADRAEIDREAGTSRYYGNIEFIQGTLRIHGDFMEVQTAGGTIRRIEVTGEPARIQQQTDAGDRVRARARSIVYRADEPLATLTGAAEVTRGGDRFSASRIRYRPDTGRIEAERTTEDPGERVRIIIGPDTVDEDADE